MPTPLVKLAYMAVTAATSALAARLLAPKQSKTPLDDSRTEPSARGTLLGVLCGHYRIGPVIGYVGELQVHHRSEHADVYRAKGWHLLNNGVGRSLRRIYKDGKAIWQGDITPTSHPSGTSVDLGGNGRFYVYWGETDQPVNAELSDEIGIASRWPGTFYIWWDTARLNDGSTLWPSYEYEITCAPSEQGLTGDSFFELGGSGYEDVPFYTLTKIVSAARGADRRSYDWYRMRVTGEDSVPGLEEGMDLNIKVGGDVVHRAEISGISTTGGYTYIEVNNPLPAIFFDTTTDTTGWYLADEPFNSDAFVDMGANPAFSLGQFLFDPKPFGAGMDRSLFDDSLQTVSDLMLSEGMPCTSLLRSGRSWKDAIASIMQDMGFLLVFNADTGLYGFRAMRDGATVTEIGQDYFDLLDMASTYAYSVLASDSRVFKYKDSSRNFADSTITANKDSFAVHGADPNVKSISLETLTSYAPASRAAARRDAEESLDGATSLDVSYLINPEVGTAVTLEGIDELYRVASVKSNPSEALRSLNLLPDAYITGSDYTTISPQGLNPRSRTVVPPDVIFDIVETNRYLTPDMHGYYMLRIRYNEIALGATVYDSSDDVTYSQSGTEVTSTGGLLIEELVDGSAALIEDGPTFEALGGDILDLVVDLSPSEEQWRGGEQMCLIGSELFFLRNIEATATENVYQLKGLIRARYGTAQAEHVVDSVVYIFSISELSIHNKTWILPGQSVYAKSSPFSTTSSVDLDNVEPSIIETYNGGGYRPLQVANLTTEDWASAWLAGSDVDLRWDYKNASSQAGAGITVSDEPSEQPLPEGYFRLDILNGSSVVRTVSDLSLGTYTYTNAQMVSDFGSEPSSFTVRVVEIFNGLTSPVEESIISVVS